VISLEDYGANPAGTSNALPAFAAIPTILSQTNGPVEISLPKGCYWLDTDEDVTQLVSITDRSNFVINGNGSEIVVRNPRVGLFNLTQCSNSIIKGFSIDYDPLPFTQGKLTAVRPTGPSVDVELAKGFPLLDTPHFEKARDRFSGTRDPNEPQRTKPGQHHTISMRQVIPLGGRRFRIFCHGEHELENAEPGDAFWAIARENGRNVVSMNQCTDVSVMDVVVHASPTVVFGGRFNDRVNILGCQVLIKPGRYISVNADVVHFHRDHIGPWIEGCRFEGCIDDVVNIYGWALNIRSILDSERIRIQGFLGPQAVLPRLKGSPVSIVDAESGSTRYRGRIVDVTHGNILTLDTPLGDRPYRLFDPSTKPADTKKPNSLEQWKADVVCVEDWMGGNSVIRNNIIRHGHRFGVILPSRFGLVENNLFEDVSASAVIVLNRMNEWPAWIKYHARGDMVIRGNTIRNCNASLTYANQNTEGDIHVGFHNRHFADADSHELSNILIENNTIRNWRQTGIHVASTSGVVIRDNKLVCADHVPALSPPAGVNEDLHHAGIVVRKCNDVAIENNRITDTRNVEAVYVEPNTVTKVRAKGNERVWPE